MESQAENDWRNMDGQRAADIKNALFILRFTAPTDELTAHARALGEAFANTRGYRELYQRECGVMEERA